MTEVLTAPGDGASYFSSSPLHRTSSHDLRSLNTSTIYIKSPLVKPSFDHTEYSTGISTPASSSSAPSSPRTTHHAFSQGPSYTSTPASSLSLDVRIEPENEDILLPSFDMSPSSEPQNDILDPSDTNLEKIPPTSEPDKDESTLRLTGKAHDDQAVEDEPTRHVDYLSHQWREEDIWSSWRYIIARRKVYSNAVRLENASWRTWAKAKHNLSTISPEELNWLKDCDVTWLYGPLHTDTKKAFSTTASPTPSRLSTSSSFLNKKPILKKKSASEAILQRSNSEHTLLKRAGAILKSQEATPTRNRPVFGRTVSDFSTLPFSPHSVVNTPAGEDSPYPNFRQSSSQSSGLQSPREPRHISFQDEVAQCIALDPKDDDEQEEEEEEIQAVESEDDEDDDGGLVMMKRVSSKAKVSNRNTPRGSFSNESKTIAHLPPTTLKYRSDTPEPPEAQKQALPNSIWNFGQRIPSSPSEVTLRPPRPHANFLIDEDDEAPDIGWQPSTSKTKNGFQNSCLSSTGNHDDEYEPGPGMRRTPSGMFMPYNEDEEESILNMGLFGRVVDTVNTARDIAHVIWNVGWRR